MVKGTGARPAVRIRRGLHGLGLVSVRAFRKGARVVEYVGETIDDAEADRRSNRYLFEVKKDLNIDGSVRWNAARYVNHACRPNCEAHVVGKRVFYVARRRILPGEELTVDYDHYIAPHGCRCDAPRHRATRMKPKKRPVR
jgi:hypothetical protein